VAGRGPNLPLSSVLLVVVGIVGVSSSGPLMAAATMVPALAISFWRTGLGAIAVGGVAVAGHRGDLRHLARREWVRSTFAGIMLAGHFAAWTSSLKMTSVASATALVSLQVAWVVVLARLSGRSIDTRVWVGLALSLAGVLVVSGVDGTISARAVAGDLLALSGGVFGAVYISVGGRVREHTTTVAYTVVCYTVCALTLAVACAVAQVPLTGFDARSWGLIVAVTVSAQILGHSVFNHLLAVISPTLVSMLLLLEVPGAALLAAVFLGQAPPIAVYAGVGLICAGLVLVVRARAGSGSRRLVEAPLD
jgi:drug/metabolite transporter (DMT)-like permease